MNFDGLSPVDTNAVWISQWEGGREVGSALDSWEKLVGKLVGVVV